MQRYLQVSRRRLLKERDAKPKYPIDFSFYLHTMALYKDNKCFEACSVDRKLSGKNVSCCML